MRCENVPQEIWHPFIVELRKGNFENALLEQGPWTDEDHSESVADVLKDCYYINFIPFENLSHIYMQPLPHRQH